MFYMLSIDSILIEQYLKYIKYILCLFHPFVLFELHYIFSVLNRNNLTPITHCQTPAVTEAVIK